MSKLFPFRQGHGHSLNFLYPRMSFAKIGLKMAQWIWTTLVDQKKPNPPKNQQKTDRATKILHIAIYIYKKQIFLVNNPTKYLCARIFSMKILEKQSACT